MTMVTDWARMDRAGQRGFSDTPSDQGYDINLSEVSSYRIIFQQNTVVAERAFAADELAHLHT